MAGFSQISVQKALYELLIGDITLMSMVTGVYDRVKENTDFPYITIGDITAQDWSTKTTRGNRLFVTLHVYSNAGGRKQTGEIMQRLYALLHDGDLNVVDHNLIEMNFESSSIGLESNGLLYHGTISFKLLVEAEAA